jgi:hypothetical protein
MNKKLKELMLESGYAAPEMAGRAHVLAELIVQHCIDVCEEMAAQCGGLPGDGALARDCAHWIRRDFGVAE